MKKFTTLCSVNWLQNTSPFHFSLIVCFIIFTWSFPIFKECILIFMVYLVMLPVAPTTKVWIIGWWGESIGKDVKSSGYNLISGTICNWKNWEKIGTNHPPTSFIWFILVMSLLPFQILIAGPTSGQKTYVRTPFPLLLQKLPLPKLSHFYPFILWNICTCLPDCYVNLWNCYRDYQHPLHSS
jgi:hypothetical protein